MTTRTTRSLLLACTAMLVISAPAVLAQESLREATALETIVVKGKRVAANPGSATDTPLTTVTIREVIENKQITELTDLGRVVEPGLNFNRATGAVNIRGLEGSRVLTTIDGIPVPYLSDATRGASGGVDAFDFNSLSAVDVLRGADSSRAGTGALGGVFGLRTLTPEDLIGQGKDWGGISKLTYNSADNSWESSAAVAKQIGGTSVLFQGSYRKGHERETNGDVDTYGPTRTQADPSDHDQHNLLFKLQQELEGGHMIGLTAERFRRDSNTDSRINQRSVLGPSDNYLPGDYIGKKEAERDRISLDYRFETLSEEALISSAWASLYWMNQSTMDGYDGYRRTTAIGPIGRENDNDERTIGLVGALQSEFTTGQLDHLLTFGLDIASGVREQYSAGYDECPPPPYPPFAACSFLHTNQADTPRVESDRIGFYVDDDITVGSTGFTLTPGIRFDWIRHKPVMTDAYDRNYTNPELPDDFQDAGISPKLRLTYDVQPDIQVYGQWAMGFRAPTAGELYSAYGGSGTYLRLGNEDLESETSNGFELGAQLGDEDFGGRVAAFYNRYKNFIDLASVTTAEAAALGFPGFYPAGISRYDNIARAEIYGVELSAHKRFSNGFRVGAGLAYTRGNDLDNDTFLRSVAPFKAAASVGYDTDTWGVGLDWIGVGASHEDDGRGPAGTNYFETPGYGLVDLAGWWEPEQAKGLRVNAGIYNVLAKTYYDYSTVRSNSGTQAREYYSEPGRSFKISLTQRF